MGKSIKLNFIYNILLNISKVLFPLITAPYVARVLEPDGVGLFNFANTLAYYFSLFAALGIPLYGIREISKIRNDIKQQTIFVSEIISVSVVTTFLCIAFLLLLLLFVPQLSDNYKVFLVASIVLYFTPIRIDWFFSGKEDFGYITIRSIVIKVISVILLFVLVRSKDDLIVYVALNAVSIVANDVWNYVKLYRSGVHPHFSLSGKRHIKPLIILFSSSIAISVYAVLDTLMLGFLTDYSEVGYYNCATHISKAFVPVVTSLAAVLLPRIAALREEKKWTDINLLMNKSFSVVGFLSFPIAFGLMAVSPSFVPLFFGEQFVGTVIPLQIVSFLVVIIGFNNLTGIQVLLGFGKDKLFLYSILFGAVSNFVLNLCLIPLYGASGAAISSLFAEILVLITMLFYVYRQTPVRFHVKRDTFFSLLFSMFFLGIGYWVFNYFEGWIGIFITIVVCASFYLLCQYYVKSSSERELISIIYRKIMKYHNYG